jgi:hypothetical protein
VFDNHRYYGIPSYHVQRMFRLAQGVAYVDTQVVDPQGPMVRMLFFLRILLFFSAMAAGM